MNPVILSFVGLLVSIPLITGCDDISRFSYENYSCQPRQSSIYEITISDLKKGGLSTISTASEIMQREIISLTKVEIIIKSDDLKLIINRKSGKVQVYAGNIYESIDCVIDKFKM